MKKLSLTGILLLATITTSCQKEVELSSCDINLFTKGSVDETILNELKDDLYYEKGWNVNVSPYSSFDPNNRTDNHVIIEIDHSPKRDAFKTKKDYFGFAPIQPEAYYRVTKWRQICRNTLKIGLPEIRFKNKQIIENDYYSPWLESAFSHDLNRIFRGACVDFRLDKKLKKLPACKIK